MSSQHLSDEQKQHLKIAQRNERRVEETYQLFTMFLSRDKPPAEALRLAIEAVEVWAEFDDSNQVDYPEIPEPDFAERIGEQMARMVDKLPRPLYAIAAPSKPSTPDQPTPQTEGEKAAARRGKG